MLAAPERFSPTARERLIAPDHELYLSAASAWEIAIKTSLGRLLEKKLHAFTHDQSLDDS
jgi:PIN domain nuclease of toxin-antitoxin system